MPRHRMMDMMMRGDMARNRRMDRMARRDYRRDMRDRGMDPDYRYSRDYRDYGDREYSSQYGDSASSQYNDARGRGDYERGRQSNRDYNDMRGGRDGHYPMNEGKTYFPIEAMGTFNGYYGMPEDYRRGGRRDYRSMDYRRDYGYDYESGMLEDEDLEEWSEKLKKHLEEKDKQFFSKEHIKRRAEEMGIKFDKFTFEEFMVTALMMYTDYCKTLGTANMDTYLRLAKDWLCDEDVSMKYGEKLAAYYDYIVEGDD